MFDTGEPDAPNLKDADGSAWRGRAFTRLRTFRERFLRRSHQPAQATDAPDALAAGRACAPHRGRTTRTCRRETPWAPARPHRGYLARDVRRSACWPGIHPVAQRW